MPSLDSKKRPELERANALMEEALALLDELELHMAAAHLSLALDSALSFPARASPNAASRCFLITDF